MVKLLSLRELGPRGYGSLKLSPNLYPKYVTPATQNKATKPTNPFSVSEALG